MKGKHQSDEARAKMSLAKRGKPAHNKGKPVSSETKRKISKSLLGHIGTPLSPENLQKMLRGQKLVPPGMLGKHHSEETRQKIRESNIGKKRSDETKQRVGNAKRGTVATPVTREKISLAHRGEKHWRWKGGRSKLYLGWTTEISHSIIIRDGGECAIHGEPHLGRLEVHHVLPYWFCFENNISNPHSEKNLISLCQSHHQRLEANPEYALPLLLRILNEKYGYAYDETFYANLMPALIKYEKNVK